MLPSSEGGLAERSTDFAGMLHSSAHEAVWAASRPVESNDGAFAVLAVPPAAYRAGSGPGAHRAMTFPPSLRPLAGARRRSRRAPAHSTRRPTCFPPPISRAASEGAAFRGEPPSGMQKARRPPRTVACTKRSSRWLSRRGVVLRARVHMLAEIPRVGARATLAVAGTSRPAPRAASCPPHSTASVRRSGSCSPSPRRLDSPLLSPFSADSMLRVHRPQNAAAIDVKVAELPSPSGACS